jgi:hypothetical protein
LAYPFLRVAALPSAVRASAMGQACGRGAQTGNSARPLSDNAPGKRRALLNIPLSRRIFADMTTRMLLLAIPLALGLAAPATAGCFADYKAKREGPLQLHYGVVELADSNCSREAAGPDIARRIGRDGWELLQVMSVFGDDGLDSRRDSAGAYFLRY